MNDQSPMRPCVEFPCDNPRLHASVARESTPDVAGPTELSDPFDWGATAHWVKETQRRWAAYDAPEQCLPVLDSRALEPTNAPPPVVERPVLEHPVPEPAFTEPTVELAIELASESPEPLSSKQSLETREPLLTPHAALDVELAEGFEAAPAEVFGADLFGVDEFGPEVFGPDESSGEVLSVSGAEYQSPAFDVEEWLSAPESDPFIDELMGFVGRDIDDVGGVFPELEESGEVRAMPRVAEVAEVAVPADPPAPDLTSVKQPAQPLVPLFLELTPTPAVVGPWVSLTGVLSRYLLNAGHTRAAALLPPMLNGELVDLTRLPEAAIHRLVIDAVAETRAGRVVTTNTFRDAARAFREAFSERSLNPSDALFWLGQLMVALCGGHVDDAALEAELEALGVMQLLENAA
jgi:hypothetical protein